MLVGSFDFEYNEVVWFETTEMKLSRLACYPVVGTVTGVAKVILGVVQLIVNLAMAIFQLLPFFMDGTSRPLIQQLKWSVHGAGNVIAGALEAIPIVGLALWLIRQQIAAYALYEPEEKMMKFMAYHSTLTSHAKTRQQQLLTEAYYLADGTLERLSLRLQRVLVGPITML